MLRETRDRPATDPRKNIILRKKKSMIHELLVLRIIDFFVGIARFELTTSCSQSRHSNRAELYPADLVSKASAKILLFFEIHKFSLYFSSKNSETGIF